MPLSVLLPPDASLEELLHINKVKPKYSGDDPVFTIAGQILKKHRLEKELGLNLLHEHFQVKKLYVMLETRGGKKRFIWVRPVKISDLPSGAVATAWRYASPSELVAETFTVGALPLSQKHYPALEEIGVALFELGAQNRFGVCRTHRHFRLFSGETILERTNERDGFQTLEPIFLTDLQTLGSPVETNWQFFNSLPVCGTRCSRYCVMNDIGKHSGTSGHSIITDYP